MIGLSRLKRAIADVPTGGMQTGTSKVQLKLCDAQRIEVEFNAIIAERDAALAQNAELVAQVEQLKGVMQSMADAHLEDGEREAAEQFLIHINATPTQCLRDIRAEVVEKYYYMGWEHSLSTKADDGDHYGCGKRLAKELAERAKAGEV